LARSSDVQLNRKLKSEVIEVGNWRENVLKAGEATHMFIRERLVDGGTKRRMVHPGNGFWISDRVFLTCHHILNKCLSSGNHHQEGDAYHLVRHVQAGKVFGEKIADFDIKCYPLADLVLIRVRDNKKRTHLKLGPAPQIGQPCYNLSYPLAKLEWAGQANVDVSAALCSARHTCVSSLDHHDTQILKGVREGAEVMQFGDSHHISADVIEVDTPVTAGACGGPLICAESGDVIGIGATIFYRNVDVPLSDTHQVRPTESFSFYYDLQILVGHPWLEQEAAHVC
jgi:S1-C subfamily serine protease